MSDVIADVLRYRAALLQARATFDELREMVDELPCIEACPSGQTWTLCRNCRMKFTINRARATIHHELTQVKL